MKKIAPLALAVAAGLCLSSLAAEAQGPAGAPDRPEFSEIDADGDGTVTQAELDTFRSEVRAARIAEVDTNGDGQIARDELLASEGTRRTAMVDRMFAELDANEDGQLDGAELIARVGLRPDRMGTVFDRADANDDGGLSAEEWDEAGLRGPHGGPERGHRGPARGHH
ncbi:hypothetical protein [uncultured Jannaschia sp.]|uniref:EF-hand domain-containing protein n=1 Tax=uncultured Jannaschia sp. TaxID=293347 RepID=UPI00263A249F|nr:hypothetical protein [uncultured Jannaschia sp.]